MIQFTNEITIQKPVEEVFDFVSDFENVPKWNYYVRRVTNLTGGEPQKGTTFHQARESDQQQYRVTEYIPNKKVVVETLPGSAPEFKIACSFEGDDRKTDFRYHWDLELANRGPGGIIEKLAARRVKDAVYQNLTKLKQLLESGQVTLQNGRKAVYKA